MVESRRSQRRQRSLAGGIAALVALSPAVCSAETLLDAIRMAYETNPALKSQQAGLRATDETYVQARAGYGPQVGVNAEGSYDAARVDQPASLFSPATSANYRAGTGSATVSGTQPLYTTGAVRAQVEAAEANVSAGRQDLRQVEAQLLLNVITAYEDVRRDRETLNIVKTEIAALDREYRETKARGELGDLTRTDIAQSQARLVGAKAQLVLAQGQLNASNAEYLNVVGQNPGDLDPPPDLPGLPAGADDAFSIAEHDNPQLLSAVEAERAADAQVKQAKAAFGPTVSLQVSAGIAPVDAYIGNQYDRSATAAVVVSVPLFTSGLNSSKVREALESDNRAQYDIETAHRGVVQLVARNWDQLVSIRSAVILEQRQLDLQTTAVQGYRAEQKVGLRSTIDLLNAELELANDQIGLLQSRHDEYIAGATLLAVLGRLEARNIAPGAVIYDPNASANRVRGRYAPPWVGAVAAVDGIAAPSGNTPVSGGRGGSVAPTPRPSVSGAETVGDD